MCGSREGKLLREVRVYFGGVPISNSVSWTPVARDLAKDLSMLVIDLSGRFFLSKVDVRVI